MKECFLVPDWAFPKEICRCCIFFLTWANDVLYSMTHEVFRGKV